ncbi:MAG: hypothetical protein KAU06_01690 [Candidatus Marinimicrobia bacterium]|nr:hypothetical protein [Candidatus Neomarinimicrobiota bacterium]
MIKNESQNAWDGKYRIDDTMFDKYSYFEIRKRINKGETKHDEFKIVLEKIIRDLQKILPILPVEFYNTKITDFENNFPQIDVYNSSQHDEKNINYYIGAYKDKISHIHEFIDDKDLVVFHYFDFNMRRMLDSEKCMQDGYLEYIFNYWQALRVRIEQKILPNFKEVLVDLNNDEMLETHTEPIKVNWDKPLYQLAVDLRLQADEDGITYNEAYRRAAKQYTFKDKPLTFEKIKRAWDSAHSKGNA